MGCAKVLIGPPHHLSMTSTIWSKSALVIRRGCIGPKTRPDVPRLQARERRQTGHRVPGEAGRAPSGLTLRGSSATSHGMIARGSQILVAPSILSADFGRLAE